MTGHAPDEPLAADAIRAAADATRQALAGSDALRALAHDLSTLGTLDATVERGLQAALTVAQAAGAMIAGRPGEQLSGLVVLGALGREAGCTAWGMCWGSGIHRWRWRAPQKPGPRPTSKAGRRPRPTRGGRAHTGRGRWCRCGSDRS